MDNMSVEFLDIPLSSRSVNSVVRPLRLGIVGLGYRSMSAVWAEEMSPGLEAYPDAYRLVALCDTDKEKRLRSKQITHERYGTEPDLFESFEEMYAKADLDAVYIAGPNYLHATMAIAAFRAGLDVLCEKPAATSLEDADAMHRAAVDNDRILAFFMQMQYRRRYHRVAELIRSGRIGEPVMVWCTEFREPFPQSMDWVSTQAKSGGALVEKNCHHCDILNLWADSSPSTVYAQGGQKKFRELYGRKSEIIDHAWINYDYQNGVKAMIGISFTQSKKHQRELGVSGTEGLVKFDLWDGEKLHVFANNGDNEVLECPGNLRGGVLMDFLHCVRTRSQPLVNFERARNALLVPLAAERSLKEKRPVTIQEIDSHPL